MKKLILLVGPPGSGKSTLALIYMALGYKRVSQDDQGKEHLDLFSAILDAGTDVIVDRMNFSKAQRNTYLSTAKNLGYHTTIEVLHQPYEVCLERCLARTNHPTIKDEKSARGALQTFFTKYERVEDD